MDTSMCPLGGDMLEKPEPFLPFALFQRGVHSGKSLVWFGVFFLVRRLPQSTPTLQYWRSCGYSWEIEIPRLNCLGSFPKRRSSQTSSSGALHIQTWVGCTRKLILQKGINAMPTHLCFHWQAGEKELSWNLLCRDRVGINEMWRCGPSWKTTSSVTVHTTPAHSTSSSLSWLHFSDGSVNFSSWPWSKARPRHGYRSD